MMVLPSPRPLGGPRPTTLLTGLTSYWKMEETSGTRVDVLGTNNLTANGAPVGGFGFLNIGCNLVAASSQYLSHVSNAGLQLGDTDKTFAAWVKLTDIGLYRIAGKNDGANGASAEWTMFYDNTLHRFRAFICKGAGIAAAVTADNFGPPVPGTWYHVVFWHDSVNDLIGISVNGIVNTTSISGGANSTATAFAIGAHASAANPMNGAVDEAGWWNKVLSPGERSALYNNGFGVTHPFTPIANPITTSLTSYWKMEETGASARVDQLGTNDLTAVNTPSSGAGRILNGVALVAASSQRLTHTSNAGLQTGNNDRTWAGWVKLTDKAATYRIAGKTDGTGAGSEWGLVYSNASDRFVVAYVQAGPVAVNATANNLGSPVAGVWYFVAVAFNHLLGQVYISVNGGVPDTAAVPGGTQTLSTIFVIGSDSAGAAPMNGVIDEAGWWARCLNPAELMALYNRGTGIAYPFTGASGNPSDVLVYTVVAGDNGATLTFSGATAKLVLVPAALGSGFSCSVARSGVGAVHIINGTGLTADAINGFRVDASGTATISISGTTMTIGGNTTANLIEGGGIATASFASTSNFPFPDTVIDDAITSYMRQDGWIRGVTFFCKAADNSSTGFNWRVFRPNGATFDFVGKTEYFPVPGASAGTNVTRTFTTPVACSAMDRAGYYNDSVNNVVWSKAGALRKVAADQQSSNAFSTTAAFTPCHRILAAPPLLGTTGDSIMAGHNTGPATWFVCYQDGGPSGNPTAQIQYQLRASVTSGVEFQNMASSGQTFAWVLSTGVPALLPLKPTWVWIHCGTNDINSGRTWAQVKSDLDAINALLVLGERLILNEIIPRSGFNDTQAATARTFNVNMAIWCATNGATLLLCHDLMGQTRGSTGQLDDLKAAYDSGDGIHPNQAGVDAMAATFKTQMGLI